MIEFFSFILFVSLVLPVAADEKAGEDKTWTFYRLITFLAVFIFMIIPIAILMKSWLVVAFFVFTFIPKVYNINISKHERKKALFFGVYILIFFASVISVVLSESFLRNFIPFPLSLVDSFGEGVFQRTPQTVLAWGIIYYSLCLITEIFLYSLRRKQQHKVLQKFGVI